MIDRWQDCERKTLTTGERAFEVAWGGVLSVLGVAEAAMRPFGYKVEGNSLLSEAGRAFKAAADGEKDVPPTR